IPLAKACEFKGSRGDGVHIWKEQERAAIRAELDAAYFHLYGIEREDAEYMLSTFSNTGLVPEDERGSQQFLWRSGSTGEMILEAFDRLQPAKCCVELSSAPVRVLRPSCGDYWRPDESNGSTCRMSPRRRPRASAVSALFAIPPPVRRLGTGSVTVPAGIFEV
ncbi:MAG: hypothetical protein AAB363_09795, partial [Planctomycetota bacterium]